MPPQRSRDAFVRSCLVHRMPSHGLSVSKDDLPLHPKRRSMAIERTLILCKPDAVSRGLVGEITARIERRGYIISAMKLMQLDGERAREHYAEHKGKPFFDDLVAFITSAPLVAMAVEGEGAIEGCRQLIGATDPLEGRARNDSRRSRADDRPQSRARQR